MKDALTLRQLRLMASYAVVCSVYSSISMLCIIIILFCFLLLDDPMPTSPPSSKVFGDCMINFV